MKLEYFEIQNLFNQYDVLLNFKNEVNIFLGENGMGKTTVLNCIYYVLSGKLEKLENVLFNSIKLKFDGNDEIFVLNKEDLDVYLERNVGLRRRGRSLGNKNLYNYLRDFDNELINSREDDWEYQNIDNYNELNFESSRQKLKNVIDFKDRLEKMVSEEVVYYPTYRRIEEDLSNLGIDFEFERRGFNNRLIQFGMEDVEKRIYYVLETIRTAAINGFTKMTGILLKQYLNNQNLEMNKEIDKDKLNIALDRIGNKIEKKDKDNIIEMVSSKEIYKNKYLLNLIVNLISSYEKQNEHDEKIRKFSKVCNEYLEGKSCRYDESNVKLDIYRNNNYTHPIDIKHLSSGEKQVLSVFSKLYLEQKDKCIILFDEPELSLSMKWQKHFLPDIMESGKCSMLIAVTHSPFIFDNDYDNLAQDMGECIKEKGQEKNDEYRRSEEGKNMC